MHIGAYTLAHAQTHNGINSCSSNILIIQVQTDRRTGGRTDGLTDRHIHTHTVCVLVFVCVCVYASVWALVTEGRYNCQL